MNYTTIESFFNEGKLEELLETYKDDFSLADDYSVQFSNNIINSPLECQEALDVLTGLYMKFILVYNIADYQYYKRKDFNKITKNPQPSTYVYLRIKNIFKAYLDGVRKAILSCQSTLKYHIEEMRMTK